MIPIRRSLPSRKPARPWREVYPFGRTPKTGNTSAAGVSTLEVTWLFLLLLLPGPVARAQEAMSEADFEAVRRAASEAPFTDQAADPLGIDPSTSELESISPSLEEVPGAARSSTGPIVTAIPGVRIATHAVDVTLDGGMARVEERIELRSTARSPAEAHLTLRVPAESVLLSLEVCQAERCRAARADSSGTRLSVYDDAVRARGGASALPIGQGAIEDAMLQLDAAPVSPRAALSVHAVWSSPAAPQGGTVRWVMPARGQDARATEMSVTVRALDVVEPRLDGAETEGVERRTTAASWTVRAKTPRTLAPRVEVTTFECEAARCRHLRVLAGPERRSAAPLVLAVDVSPSTADGARGRIEPTVRAIVSALPPETPIALVRFAGTAERIAEGTASTLQMPTALVERELGSATRLESLAPFFAGAFRSARLIVVGDGGLTSGEAGSHMLNERVMHGHAVSLIDVGDRPEDEATQARWAGARFFFAGAEAEVLAAHGASEDLLSLVSPALSSSDARRVRVRVAGRAVELGALVSGELLELDVASVGALRVEADGRALGLRSREELASARSLSRRPVRWVAAEGQGGACRMHAPFAAEGPALRPGESLELAWTRRCDAAASVTTSVEGNPRASGVPPQVLLASMRRRIIPLARGCFRDDRRGRPRESRQVEITLTLAEREVVDGSVRGQIEPRLRSCLLASLDQLDIPRFEGAIHVTWPLHTEAVAPPPVIELTRELAGQVDAIVAEPETR
jgi:hypothetical protein